MRSVLTFVLMLLFAALALDIAVPALVLLTAIAAERLALRLRLLPMGEPAR